MTHLAVRTMTRRLTLPFARGSDTLLVALTAAGDATQAPVAPYDFREHLARFERPPEPRYVLVAQRDMPRDTAIRAEYAVEPPVGPDRAGSITINVPAGTRAGSSFAVDLGDDEGVHTRLVRIRMDPAAADGEAAHWWRLVALLGNLAKLLWAVGWERDHVRRHLARVQAQRHLSASAGVSLDLLGSDLGVPRFPPLPYSVDAETVALYHLDDQPAAEGAEVAEVEDIMARYGGVGHHGANVDQRAQSGASGRFGRAFAFQQADAEIRIPAHAAFNAGATQSFTVECFVKPDAVWHRDREGHLLAKHADPADASLAGWALSVGEFGRGVPVNVRFLLSDGSNQITLFADISVTGERFQHLAGVIDRDANEARLYVDGTLHDAASTAALASLANSAATRIGHVAGAPLRGAIDEVRVSRVARSNFHPVLGESDAAYRRRLRIFERWTLPTPAALQESLNAAVDEIGGEPEPLVLQDADATMVGGTHAVTIVPTQIAPGRCMDAAGNRRSRERDISGTAARETAFDPIYLVTHADPRVIYAALPTRTLDPGERAPDTRKMQQGTQQRLDRLLEVLAEEGIGGLLQVESAFDPRAADLRAVGRGLLLTHSDIDLGHLAALAHRAGFAYVCHRSRPGAVYVSVPPGDYLNIQVVGGSASGTYGFDLLVGETLELAVQPSLPPDTLYRWSTIACGAGRVRFTTRTDRPGVTVEATAPGELAVKVTATRRRRTVSGTRVFRIGLAEVEDDQSIGADGTLGVGEDVAGKADDFFHPAYLVTHDHARITYGGDLNNRRMQPAVAQRLNRLLDRIERAGATGTLQVAQAYRPESADPLARRGRALALRRNPSLTLSPGELAAVAHAAGFTYVRRAGNDIVIRQSPGALVTPAGRSNLSEGESIELTVQPRAIPRGIAVHDEAMYVANSGTDTLSEIDPATGEVRRALKVGWDPRAVVLDPAGERVYSADFRSNTVTAADVAAGEVLQSIAVQEGPVALAHHPREPRLYIACRVGGVLALINTDELEAVDALEIGSRPTALALTPDGAEIWVVLDEDAQVAIVDSASFSPADRIDLPAAPLDIALASEGEQGYVTLPAAGQLAIVDVAARGVDRLVSVPGRPGHVTIAPDGSTVYVTDTANEQLYLLERDGTVRGRIDVGRAPAAVAASSNRVYVTNRSSDTLSVLDPAEMGLLFTWRLGSGLGERLTWSLSQGAHAQARLSSTTVPQVRVRGEQAGPILARATYTLRDNTDPYTFAVRLKPALEADGVIIRKEQYDQIMNVLNAFHPIGVEVITRAIRERVIEVRDELLNAFPDYTYPNYRVRGRVSRPVRRE